jgi:hypothetical protein
MPRPRRKGFGPFFDSAFPAWDLVLIDLGVEL